MIFSSQKNILITQIKSLKNTVQRKSLNYTNKVFKEHFTKIPNSTAVSGPSTHFSGNFKKMHGNLVDLSWSLQAKSPFLNLLLGIHLTAATIYNYTLLWCKDRPRNLKCLLWFRDKINPNTSCNNNNNILKARHEFNNRR